MARVRAPELRGAGGWIGTDRPLSLAALRGKVVLLDFWTFCCINCLRVLEELRPLEERWRDELVVVGVHSPKFPHETDHQAVIDAVARHRVTHPVLDDPARETWDQYGVRGWPTLVLVDPEGYVVGGISGEGCGPALDDAIAKTVAEHDAKGTLVRGEVAPAPPAGAAPPSTGPLSFPGKVAVDPNGRRIAIADTGRDRVIVADLAGRADTVLDGFTQPQGVRFDGTRLVVCDTVGSRVVAVDLMTGARDVLATGLASPWDVCVAGDGTYVVAEAGRHRLWSVGRDGGKAVLAGTGGEHLVDGPAELAQLAQPSGVAPVDGGIVFADSESSALRLLSDAGGVTTLVGHGLFEWGDSDGDREAARLQHPLGVAAHGDRIYVADTFNSRLRVWHDGVLSTLAVTGLAEPGGLDVLPDGRLVVADTGNHRIVLVDPAGGGVEPIVVDLSWLDAEAGEPLTPSAGGTVTVTYLVDTGGLALDHAWGPPVRVIAGEERFERETAEGTVAVTVAPGATELLVETVAATCDADRCTVVRSRRRHPLA